MRSGPPRTRSSVPTSPWPPPSTARTRTSSASDPHHRSPTARRSGGPKGPPLLRVWGHVPGHRRPAPSYAAVMSYRHLLIKDEDGLATITLNRPEKRNALSEAVMLELTEAFRAVGESAALGVILAANGPVFSAGHNFADMAGADLAKARQLFKLCVDMMDAVQAIPQPVVAKVHALATAAGCQLVATCDLAVASDAASFALPGGKGGL